MPNEKLFVPAGEGAIALGITRDRMIRRIQAKTIDGTFEREPGRSNVRWFVSRDAIAKELARKSQDAVPA